MSGERILERLQKLVVQITRHADSEPRRSSLRWIALPALERARVVAIRAIHAQRRRHVCHQAVGPLRLLDGLPIARGQWRGPIDADVGGFQQERRERIVG